jgi:hypothetical protein
MAIAAMAGATMTMTTIAVGDRQSDAEGKTGLRPRWA